MMGVTERIHAPKTSSTLDDTGAFPLLVQKRARILCERIALMSLSPPFVATVQICL